jgi:hypothetical protein
MKRLATLCLAAGLALTIAACGGSTKTVTTAATPPSTPSTPSTTTTTPPTDTQGTQGGQGTQGTTSTQQGQGSGGVSDAQRAETRAAAKCLVTKSRKIKGSQQYGKPAILGYLPSGNVVALVLYGPSGGAKAGEAQITREHPKFDAYNSPNDKILIFYGRKADKSDFNIGNVCQKEASAAG